MVNLGPTERDNSHNGHKQQRGKLREDHISGRLAVEGARERQDDVEHPVKQENCQKAENDQRQVLHVLLIARLEGLRE